MKINIPTLYLLCVLLFCMGTHVYAQGQLRIMSYNVLYGFMNDSVTIDRHLKFIKAWDADIVAYQEMNGFNQRSLEKLAQQYAHPYALQSKVDGWPVAITSKYPPVNFKKVVENMWHSYLYCKIKGVHIFVIHFSPRQYEKRRYEVENIIAQAAEIPDDEPILIMGDFNALDARDSVNYGTALLDAMIDEETDSRIRNLNNKTIDYSVLNKLKTAGFVDTYWLNNTTFESSMPTFKDGQGNINSSKAGHPRRIDFIWANETAARLVVKSGIIKNEDTHYISDHYPTFVELTLP